MQQEVRSGEVGGLLSHNENAVILQKKNSTFRTIQYKRAGVNKVAF